MTTRAAAATRCPKCGRPRGDLSSCVEIEELDGHLLNRRARALALLGPALSPKLVQARRWRVTVGVTGRAVSLDLIDPVQWNVEPVATFVLDDGNLHGALAHEDGLQPAIDADAVFQVHHEVAGLESGDGFERRPGRITTRASESALAAEDLVIRQDAIRPVARTHHQALR